MRSTIRRWSRPVARCAAQRGPGRVGPRAAVHPAAGMGGRAGQVEPVDRGLGPAEPGQRPEDQLLVDAGGSAADRAVVQVGVRALQVQRRLHDAGQDRSRKPGALPFDHRLDQLDVRRTLLGAQRRDLPAGGCRPRPTRSRRGSGSGPLVVIWPSSRNGSLGICADGQRGGVAAQAVQVDAEVDGAGAARRASAGPRDRAGQRPVDLEGRGVPLEPAQVLRPAGSAAGPGRPGRGRAPGRRRRPAPRCRAAMRSPSASRTPTARPAAIVDRVDRAIPARSWPPRAVSRSTSAAVSRPGPADRNREPDGLAEHRQQPAVQRAAGALRARGRRAGRCRRSAAGPASPRNCSSPNRRTGSDARTGRSAAGRRSPSAGPAAAPAGPAGTG